MKTQFETWWENEGFAMIGTMSMMSVCKIAWENGAFCATHPIITTSGYVSVEDDMSEPLGKACQLGDTNCESCS